MCQDIIPSSVGIGVLLSSVVVSLCTDDNDADRGFEAEDRASVDCCMSMVSPETSSMSVLLPPALTLPPPSFRRRLH